MLRWSVCFKQLQNQVELQYEKEPGASLERDSEEGEVYVGLQAVPELCVLQRKLCLRIILTDVHRIV